jgi:hypothetical protein
MRPTGLLSIVDPLSQAAQNVVTVAKTSDVSLSRLRQWASRRCLDAELGRIYQFDAGGSVNAKARRRVTRSHLELN